MPPKLYLFYINLSQIFLVFLSLLGVMIEFDSYFSNWLETTNYLWTPKPTKNEGLFGRQNIDEITPKNEGKKVGSHGNFILHHNPR